MDNRKYKKKIHYMHHVSTEAYCGIKLFEKDGARNQILASMRLSDVTCKKCLHKAKLWLL